MRQIKIETLSEAKAILIHGLRDLKDGENWIKGAFFGEDVTMRKLIESGGAVCMCSIGAVVAQVLCAPDSPHDNVDIRDAMFLSLRGGSPAMIAVDFLSTAVDKKFPSRAVRNILGSRFNVAAFNDHKDTTFADVKAVFEAAIEMIEA